MNSFCRAMLGVALAGGMVAGVSGPAGASSCTIKGTDGDDVLTGTDGPDVICALGGNDVIHALGGNDIVYGGPGDDEIHGGPGNDRLWGKTGDDTIYGDEGDDKIGGAAGNDRLYGGPGADKMYGSAGDDTMFGGLGPDRMFGGDGEDYLGGGVDTGNGVVQTDFSPNYLGGGAGWDVLRGAKGNDKMYFGTDGGRAFGDDGNDRIVGPTSTSTPDNHVAMWGGKGDDVMIANKAGSGSGRYVEGLGDMDNGEPIASYFNGGGGHDIVYGSAFGDFIVNSVGLIKARGGDDTLVAVGGRVFGGEGNDSFSSSDSEGSEFIGGPGNDYLAAPGHNSVLRGGPGADTIDAFGYGTLVIWTGSDNDVDVINGVSESDRCYAARIDVVNGVCTR